MHPRYRPSSTGPCSMFAASNEQEHKLLGKQGDMYHWDPHSQAVMLHCDMYGTHTTRPRPLTRQAVATHTTPKVSGHTPTPTCTVAHSPIQITPCLR